jgi:hypothetical protein
MKRLPVLLPERSMRVFVFARFRSCTLTLLCAFGGLLGAIDIESRRLSPDGAKCISGPG